MNSFKHQLDSAREELLAEVPTLFPYPPHPQARNPRLYYTNSCYPNPLFIVIHNRYTLKLFCIALPYLYVVIEDLCGPLDTSTIIVEPYNN